MEVLEHQLFGDGNVQCLVALEQLREILPAPGGDKGDTVGGIFY